MPSFTEVGNWYHSKAIKAITPVTSSAWLYYVKVTAAIQTLITFLSEKIMDRNLLNLSWQKTDHCVLCVNYWLSLRKRKETRDSWTADDPETYWPFLWQNFRWKQQLHVCLWAAEYTIGEFDQNKAHIWPRLKLWENCPWWLATSHNLPNLGWFIRTKVMEGETHFCSTLNGGYFALVNGDIRKQPD